MTTSEQKQPVTAMVFAVSAMACFAVLDTSNKFLIASVPLLMVLWFRYLFQAVVTTAVMWPRRGMTMQATLNRALFPPRLLARHLKQKAGLLLME